MGPPTRTSSPTSFNQHLRHEFVDEAASERFKSTASMPSMKPQRSAPAPTAVHTLCRLHACLSSVPWRRAVRCQPFAHRVSGRQLVFASGALSPGASYWEATGARFGDVAEVRSRRQASNSSPMGPVSPVAAAHGCRLCALRHPCARRGARRWRQLDAPRARRRHCRHGRRRRPLRRPSRPRAATLGRRAGRLVVVIVCVHARDVHVEPWRLGGGSRRFVGVHTVAHGHAGPGCSGGVDCGALS